MMNSITRWWKPLPAGEKPASRYAWRLGLSIILSLAALTGLGWVLSRHAAPAFADSPPSAATLTRAPAGPLFPGAVVQFTAAATGTQPFTYTWTLNGASVGGNAPTWTYTFTDAGLYTVSVLITNTFGQDSAALLVPVRGCEARVASSGVIYPSAQAAIDAAPPGGVVQLAGACRGVTTRGGLQQTAYISKSLTLRGGYPGLGDWSASNPAAYPTLLDAQGGGRALAVIGPANVTVEGLTLTGGNANGLGGIESSNGGGGVYLSGATVTLTNCAVVTNVVTTAYGRGGGVAVNGGNVVIANSRIAYNRAADADDYSAEYGGGLYAFGGTVNVVNSTLSDNSTRYGGGAYLTQNGIFTFTDNVIAHNTLAWDGNGGGVYLAQGALHFAGNTVAANDKSGVVAQGDALWIADNTIRNQGEYALSLTGAGVTVQGNTLTANKQGVVINGSGLVAGNVISGCWGGTGLTLWGSAEQTAGQTFTVTGNLILHNTTTGDGGGVYARAYRVAFSNNVIAFNHANGNGSGLYLLPRGSGSGSDYTRYHYTLLHNTVNNNTGANGIYLRGPASFGPIQAELKNNLIANHAVGVDTGWDNDVTLMRTLWRNNTTDVTGAATRTGDLTGDPALAADGYHLSAGSAALDAGSPSAGLPWQDIDGDARPAGFGYDIGADEVAGPALQLTQTPSASRLAHGETVVYADTVNVAGGAVSGLVVTLTLPVEQQALAATSNRGTCVLVNGYGGGAVCTLGNTPAGTTVLLTVTAGMTTTPILPAAMPGALTATLTARAAQAANALSTPLAFQYCRANVNGVIYNTLQAAVDAAPTGALVKAAGYCDTFNARGSEIVYLTKTLTLRGGYTLANWETSDPAAQPTTLDGRLAGRGILIQGAGVAPTVEGLRIINGNGSGIFVGGQAAPILRGNTLEGNVAAYTPDGALPTTGAGAGGGICVSGAPNTQIIANTFRANRARYGGGLNVYQSNGVVVQNNQFLDNQAGQFGGGLEFNGSNVQALDNHFQGNAAGGILDFCGGGAIAATSGGPTLRGNTLAQNSAPYGGGMIFRNGGATATENVIANNAATEQGGGVYVEMYSAPVLSANTITSNTAKTGGGVYVDQSASSQSITLRYNRIGANRATGGNGGGVYISWRTYGELVGNAVTGNAATGDGGGLWVSGLGYDGRFTLHSNAVVGNHADGQGGGIYHGALYNGVWRHTTLGQNTSSDGAAVTLGPGSNPAVNWEYSVIYSQTVGVNQTGSSGGALNHTLWSGVATRTQGAALTTADDLTGEPRLRADGYHLALGSAAIDAAPDSTVATDIDAEPRPQGPYRDLGADEYRPQVALSLTKQRQGPGSVMGGTGISYTLTVANAPGGETTPDVVVTDTIAPAGAVAALSARAQNTPCTVNGAQVVCTLLNAPIGGAETFTVWVTPTTNYSGRLTNTAELVALDAVDSTPADNAAGPVVVTVTAPLPDVWITKAVAESYIAPGGTLHYTLTWGNRGLLPAANVVITDTLPADVTYQQASGNPTQNGQTLTWNVGPVAVGGGGVLTVTGAAGAGLPNWTPLVNRAGIRTSDAEPTLLNNQAVVTNTVSDTGGNEFWVSLTADKTRVTIDDTVNFEAQVTNEGETWASSHIEVAPDYGFAAIVPGSVRSVPAGATYDAANMKISLDVLLAPGESAYIYYTAKVEYCGFKEACGGVKHTVSAWAPGIPQPWRATRLLTIYCAALKAEVSAPRYFSVQSEDAAIVKVSYANLNVIDPDYGALGKPIHALLTLYNGNWAGKVKFVEALGFPPGIIHSDGAYITWDLGELAPGDTGEVRAVVDGSWTEMYAVRAKIEAFDPAEAHECDSTDNYPPDAQIYPMSLNFEKRLMTLTPHWEPDNKTLSLDVKYRLLYKYTNTHPAHPRISTLLVSDSWPQGFNLVRQYSWPRLAYSFQKVGSQLSLYWGDGQSVDLAVGDHGFIELTGKSDPNVLPEVPQPGFSWNNLALATFEIADDPEGEQQFVEVAHTAEVPLVPPYFTFPAAGSTAHICPGPLELEGLAQPNTTVEYSIFEIPQGTRPVQGSYFNIPLTIPYGDGAFSVEARTVYSLSESGILTSELSENISLWVHSNQGWDPLQSAWNGQVKDGPNAGQTMSFSFRDWRGHYVTNGWEIPGVYGFWDTTLWLRLCPCPDPVKQEREATVIADGVKYGPQKADGEYATFQIGLAHLGVQIQTVCKDKETEEEVSGTATQDQGDVLIDPDGFVFDIDRGGDYSGAGGMFNPVQAISGVTVTAYVSAPRHGGWMLWPAHVYSQTNPQVTDATYPDGITTTGYFAFFTPPGLYYLKVEGLPADAAHPQYQEWRSPVITVTNQIVHVNVPYTPWTDAAAPYPVLVMAEMITPTVLTIPVGSTVEWRSEITTTATFSDYVQLTENPTLRVKSARDPLADTRAFDAGYLEPGRVYRRQFKWPGVYPYTDGAGHTGVIVVQGAAPPLTVDLGGPATGYVGEPLTFAASVAPPTATLPITYTWRTAGGEWQNVRHALSDTATFTWTAAGEQAITVTVQNPYTTATASQAVLINRRPQTITFPALADKPYNAPPFTITATASSGLPVTFTADGVCSVQAITVTLTGSGVCTITAHQAGDAVYAPAPDVMRAFTVAPPPCNPPASVQITGPATTTVGVPTIFTATVTPLTMTVILPFTFPLTYTWQATNYELRITNYGNSLQDTAAFTWTAAGTRVVTVTVASPCGTTVQDTELITVAAPPVQNRPPVADAGPDQTVAPGALVTLDGAASSDPDGDALLYRWRQTGGAAVSFTPTLSRTTFLAASPGVLTFTLTVTDTGGLAHSDSVVVTVEKYRIYLPLVLRSQSTTHIKKEIER
ncbi:MAG TPA: PKD domain-containing protein [Anaerolineae bacterium]|nr:PKD domain-containing protein [Anaerolineae bacterium]